MDKENFLALLKSLGLGAVYSLIFWFITAEISKGFEIENTNFLIPYVILAGILMAISLYGSDDGIGYVGAFLFFGGYIAIGVVAIVASIVCHNPVYLGTIGGISPIFILWYKALGNGNSNLWVIGVLGGIIISALTLGLMAILFYSQVFGIILTCISVAITAFVIIKSRIENGSILDI